MDITTIAAWGEFIGGIAVVVSLISLAVQIRINTKTVRSSNSNDLLDPNSQFSAMIVDPENASLYLRGLDDFVGLNAVDQLRFQGLMAGIISSVNRALNFHEQALIDRKVFEAQVNSIAILFGNPGMRQWWETNQHWWPADLRELVRGAAGE